MSAKLILIGAGVVGAAAGYASLPVSDNAGTSSAGSDVHYTGCNQVRALGKAPLYYDQPGYDPKMDGDGDGIACEPHH